jgi:hypothetical protein
MPEREGGFTPENEKGRVDITEVYLNSSRSELAEYLGDLPDDAKIEMNIEMIDVVPDSIRYILTKFETAKIIIRASEQDREYYKNTLPWKGVEWVVEQE